jgi:hypothetical protein
MSMQTIPAPGRVADLERQLAEARAAAPAPQAYAGPGGAGQLAAPLPPAVPPAPPAEPDQPHPGETFTPGELAYYAYHDHRDKPGAVRAQVVVVTHTDDDHVHALVLGDAGQLASFARGQLTHAHPAAAQ